MGGSSGIIVGSVVWALFHPVNRLLFQNIRLLEVARFTPLWILDAVFYVRVWRGRYYWASFFAHALTNIDIVLGGMSGLPQAIHLDVGADGREEYLRLAVAAQQGAVGGLSGEVSSSSSLTPLAETLSPSASAMCPGCLSSRPPALW